MLKHLRQLHGLTESGRLPADCPTVFNQRPTRSDADTVISRDRDYIIMRLAAEDNQTFKTIAKSSTLTARVYVYSGSMIPKSPSTIKNIVMRQADGERAKIKEALTLYQKQKGTFAIAFDEATAVNAPHRYLGISVRQEPKGDSPQEIVIAGPGVCLGIVKLQGSATAENIGNVLKTRLSDYGISFNNCGFAVTDGASVMK